MYLWCIATYGGSDEQTIKVLVLYNLWLVPLINLVVAQGFVSKLQRESLCGSFLLQNATLSNKTGQKIRCKGNYILPSITS